MKATKTAAKTIAFFDTKPYDRTWFERLNASRPSPYVIRWHESRLRPETVRLAEGCEAVCAFVNDEISTDVVQALVRLKVRIIAMRCAGLSNVDLDAACGCLPVVRVPAYSPDSVAEHAAALMLAVNRHIPRAYARTRDFNFNIAGLEGMVLHDKTAGIIGTGRIGIKFAEICRGLGMRVLGYDTHPAENTAIEYVPLERLLAESDVISLHCPLTDQTRHIIGKYAFRKIKKGALLINTSRGALIDSDALVEALNNGTLRGAGLDVYEEESDLFYEDRSNTVARDEILSLLIAKPNVLLTAHQAFLTDEALENIARTTLSSLDAFFAGEPLAYEACAPEHRKACGVQNSQ